MKKLLITVFMLAGIAAFAGVQEPFKQFTQDAYTFNPRTEEGQNNYYQSMMTLSVGAGSGVWLTNFVENWSNISAYDYQVTPDLNGYAYDMKGSQKYGYIDKADITKIAQEKGVGINDLQKSDYQDAIKWAKGETMMIRYDDGQDHYYAETQAYFLDYFDADAEIYLVLTTLADDGGETVDAYQFVKGGEPNAYDTTLISRQITANPQLDLAGNVRINYGVGTTYETSSGREFVAVYDNGTYSSELERASYASSSTGGPLPGVFFAGLLSLGTVFGASKARRQKRA